MCLVGIFILWSGFDHFNRECCSKGVNTEDGNVCRLNNIINNNNNDDNNNFRNEENNNIRMKCSASVDSIPLKKN